MAVPILYIHNVMLWCMLHACHVCFYAAMVLGCYCYCSFVCDVWWPDDISWYIYIQAPSLLTACLAASLEARSSFFSPILRDRATLLAASRSLCLCLCLCTRLHGSHFLSAIIVVVVARFLMFVQLIIRLSFNKMNTSTETDTGSQM